MSYPSTSGWLVLLLLISQTECREQAQPVQAPTTKTNTNTTVGSPVDLHKCVEHGTLEQLEQALKAGADVNQPGHCGQTPLMVAIAAKDLAKMKRLVEHGADPEITDDFNATALSHAVSYDYAAGVKYLLDLGVDRGYSPKYPLKKQNIDLSPLEVPLPKELVGVLSEEEWQESVENTQEQIAEMNQHPTAEPIIADVQSIAVLKLFLAAGDHLDLAPTEVKRAYVGLQDQEAFACSIDDYRRFRQPQFGRTPPTPMDNPFWQDMIRLGVNAYAARTHFNDTDSLDTPVWCYDRFGSTLTPLPDGRFVQIGGEHEDYYDPDFTIYNDVVVHNGQGDFNLFGYPRDKFPPTDFHSATLVGKHIYIVGCLGYPDQREIGCTPVYRLTIDSWKIDRIETTGDMPSWLHRHRAKYHPQRNTIEVSGGDTLATGDEGETVHAPNQQRYELNLESLAWQKLHSLD